jgi:hypothetical protein
MIEEYLAFVPFSDDDFRQHRDEMRLARSRRPAFLTRPKTARGVGQIAIKAGVATMGTDLRTELVMALAWLSFPMLPVLLEEVYYGIFVNLFGWSDVGPEPRDWGWGTWVIMLGPLLGYGFLAGSTAEVPDDLTGPKKGLRRVVARRAVWVAIAPWCGFLFVLAVFFGLGSLSSGLPQQQGPDPPSLASWRETWLFAILSWVWTTIVVGILAYGWVWPARAALRRAGRIGIWRRALYRGIVTAPAFVGSLFGSFWAITSARRSYFFDPRVMPLILAALGLSMMSGCSSTITYGEMRRRELFHAMLLSWVFGMAMIWWWSSRRRPKGSR